MNNPILFDQVQRKLNITWSDTETNTRVEEIIDNAIPDLIHRLGITDKNFDFSVPGNENTLFKNYCLYEWNHCLNEFFDNYAESIAQIRAKNEVNNFLEGGGSVDTDNEPVDVDVSLEQTEGGVRITVTDEDGTETATVKHGKDGEDGQDGEDGKTPEKGVDYFTEADKNELVTDVINSLPLWNGGAY